MDANFPLVSVVIPFYNHGKYIHESVDSALRQNYPNLEVLVVDDGSTDVFSLQVLEEIKQKATVLRKDNGHLSSARNFGIKHAKGELILVLDSDDYFHPSFLEKAVPIILSDVKVGLVGSWVQYFGDEKHIAKTKEGTITDFLVVNTFIASNLLKKSVWENVGGYNESMKRGMEDWDFTISVLKHEYQIKVIEEPLLYYRKEGESMSTYSEINRAEIFMEIVNHHRELFEKNLDAVLFGKEQEITRLRLLNKKLSARLSHYDNRLSIIENSFLFRLSSIKSKLFKKLGF